MIDPVGFALVVVPCWLRLVGIGDCATTGTAFPVTIGGMIEAV
jgi:hypothetical protein